MTIDYNIIMKKIVSILLVLAGIACQDHPIKSNDTGSNPVNPERAVREPYYPISQYIESQVAYVDTTPLAIELITFINNKRVDSTVIDRKAFRILADEFMKPDLNDKNVQPLYEENSFNDLTLNTITFTYTARDRNQELQQEDVLLNPDNNRVKNVMFRKNRMNGDTSVSINGLWNHNMNFQLNYSFQPAKGNTQTKQLKVIWDRPMVND